MIPAIPVSFWAPISSKILTKPPNPADLKTTNIVTDHARNNSLYFYRADSTKTAVYRYSFCPRTTIDWNNLEKEIVAMQ